MAEVNFLVKQGLTVPKGSASTPAIIFDASAPNTGIYSPAADQVAISTNGTGRLFVDASGNVGVGASPTTKFTIFGDTHNVRVQQAAGLATAVHGYEITTAFVVDAYFKARGSTGELQIGSGRSAAWGGFISFYTDTAERARIDSSGRLGLGTSSPSELLTVAGAEVNIGLYNSTIGSSDTPSFGGIKFYGYLQTPTGNIASISAGNSQASNFGGILRFSTNTTGGTHTERMRIDSSGNVGIGVTSPGDKLEIGGSGSGIILASPDGTRYKLTVANGGTLSIAAA